MNSTSKRILEKEKMFENVLTSVDYSRVRLDLMLSITRRRLMGLLSFAVMGRSSGDLGEGSSLDVGIYSKY